jgi:hypothetical protein
MFSVHVDGVHIITRLLFSVHLDGMSTKDMAFV